MKKIQDQSKSAQARYKSDPEFRKKHLDRLKVPELKEMIKYYMAHLKIKISGKRKAQLISDLLSHTEKDENGKIIVIPLQIPLPDAYIPEKNRTIGVIW